MAEVVTKFSKRWYKGARLHREDGPAVEYYNGEIEWWLNGYQFTFKRFLQTIDDSDAKMILVLRYSKL